MPRNIEEVADVILYMGACLVTTEEMIPHFLARLSAGHARFKQAATCYGPEGGEGFGPIAPHPGRRGPTPHGP